MNKQQYQYPLLFKDFNNHSLPSSTSCQTSEGERAKPQSHVVSFHDYDGAMMAATFKKKSYDLVT